MTKTKTKTTKLTHALTMSVRAIDRELARLTSPLLSNHTEHAVESLEAARRDLVALISLKTPR